MFRILLILVFAAASIRPAVAQSIYVAGALGADISLVSGQESFGVSSPAGGEALSGGARVGVVLEDRWGVEVEVSRAAEMESDLGRGGPVPLGALFPIILPEVSYETRITTVTTTASLRQQIADRVALVYLGGIVFHRTDSEIQYPFVRGIPTLSGNISYAFSSAFEAVMPAGIALPSTRIESVQYGAGPVAGIEAHIGYGDHISIIPGFRMHGLPDAWLLRPAVAVGWTF
jgi:hypothetical protein